MKKIAISLLVVVLTGSSFPCIAQDSTVSVSHEEANLMRSCYGYLKGAQSFGAVVNGFEIVGGGLIGLGAALNGKADALYYVGFLLAFPGMEMSKFTPKPATMAKHDLISLRTSWKDTTGYNTIFRQVVVAEKLSYATMGLAFSGQFLAFMGVVVGDNDLQTTLFVLSIACTGVSVGTAVGATVMSGIAKHSLGKHMGSLGVSISPQGIGTVYTLPK